MLRIQPVAITARDLDVVLVRFVRLVPPVYLNWESFTGQYERPDGQVEYPFTYNEPRDLARYGWPGADNPIEFKIDSDKDHGQLWIKYAVTQFDMARLTGPKRTSGIWWQSTEGGIDLYTVALNSGLGDVEHMFRVHGSRDEGLQVISSAEFGTYKASSPNLLQWSAEETPADMRPLIRCLANFNAARNFIDQFDRDWDPDSISKIDVHRLPN